MTNQACFLTALLTELSDGNCATIDQLEATLQVEREQIVASLDELRDYGVEFESEPCGTGLTWHQSRKLIRLDDVLNDLPEETASRVAKWQLDLVCNSTNLRVLDLGVPNDDQVFVSLCEYQTAGRGRRGSIWKSALASGICLTIALPWRNQSQAPGAFTLAMGVAVSQALSTFLTPAVLLKWPNDLILSDQKLGGILTELVRNADGSQSLIVGIGINVDGPDPATVALENLALKPVGLKPGLKPGIDRARIVAELIRQIVQTADAFKLGGFSLFHKAWNDLDYLYYRTVQVFGSERIAIGVAQGVDEQGALIINVDDKIYHLNSGEVRVRPQ